MVLMTMIARVADGLPLSASMQEHEQSGTSLLEYQNQAKMIFRKLKKESPDRCSIQTGKYMFHYMIQTGICYLILCEQSFSKHMAFAYLQELHQEFYSQYGKKISTVSRPYPFIEFDTFMQKLKRTYNDKRGSSSLSNINSELQGVQRIMVQNIDDVMQRGVALSELDNKAQNLSTLSQKYSHDAKYLNLRSRNAKIAAVVTVIVLFLIFLRYWVF
ncbi:Vesicle-trafficking protein SEC22b [Holothuria leucospilota]|uniref:Vesicle-trafficking protein SEC22b n=1 Tax=Holothuria leucospilota TaxID=206669 RepID=A0A9Q1HBS6_HOLLE|nr:Vesicle-trafficking protein SEC22b [Holothuria leucospilota]